MTIKREIEPSIIKALFKGKVIMLYGARQVGKTTLVRQTQQYYPEDSVYLNCDEPDIREVFTDKTSTPEHIPRIEDRFFQVGLKIKAAGI